MAKVTKKATKTKAKAKTKAAPVTADELLALLGRPYKGDAEVIATFKRAKLSLKLTTGGNQANPALGLEYSVSHHSNGVQRMDRIDTITFYALKQKDLLEDWVFHPYPGALPYGLEHDQSRASVIAALTKRFGKPRTPNDDFVSWRPDATRQISVMFERVKLLSVSTGRPINL